jgi:hypothetical protein
LWYDQTKPSSVALLVGDYHQMGVWMAAGGKVVAFDPAPTMMKGMLTAQRIMKGTKINIHTYHSRFIPEGVAVVSQIFVRDRTNSL